MIVSSNDIPDHEKESKQRKQLGDYMVSRITSRTLSCSLRAATLANTLLHRKPFPTLKITGARLPGPNNLALRTWSLAKLSMTESTRSPRRGIGCKREGSGLDADDDEEDDEGVWVVLKNEKDPSSTATWPSESIRISKAKLAVRWM